MIRFDNVAKNFGAFAAVKGLSLEIPEKALCVLVGPSGSGKSTLLRMVNNLVEPTSGTVYLGGRPVNSIRPEELRRGIGYVIQSVGLFPHMTVAQNIAVVPQLLKWKKDRIQTRVEELLTLVGLDPARYARRAPSALSGGEAQRVGVARALAADPPVLLMDEPFSAVDPVTRFRLQGEFLSIQKRIRKTIVFVTHDVDEAIRLADKVAILKAGTLVQYDVPEVILSQPTNAFVEGFVGSDRALKRLSRFTVADHTREASTAVWDGRSLVPKSGDRYCWVVDTEGRLLGHLDQTKAGSDEGEGFHRENIGDLAVGMGASLKEALSTMIGTGARSLAVVDAGFRLVGAISLNDIEAVAGQA